MSDRHPGGRVVACSHGDVIPVFLALVCGLFSTPVPEPADHGGWYHLRFSAGSLRVATRP